MNRMGACFDRLRYWNIKLAIAKDPFSLVATVHTACGMRRRVRGSRGAKRRWGPHISSPWPEGRENRGDKAIVLTVYGIETSAFSASAFILACCNSTYRLRYWNSIFQPMCNFNASFLLQQYLPLVVLKQSRIFEGTCFVTFLLQQCLPFTVLKH